MNNSKELILHNIKNGLASSLRDVQDDGADALENIFLEKVIEKSQTTLINQLKEESLKVNGEVKGPKKSDDIINDIKNVFDENSYENFLIWETKFIIDNQIKDRLQGRGLTCIKSKSIKKLSQAEVGITEVDYAIADTGTLVLFSENKKTRISSVLPSVHIAILKAENILSNIHELFSFIKKDHPNLTELSSCITFITGPSRTADIELTLTLGVHGPARLIVFIYE